MQLPAWGLWLLWQYVLQPYFMASQPEVSQLPATDTLGEHAHLCMPAAASTAGTAVIPVTC